ncbi:MAG: DMT family transporter, partial [Halobacteria archaeon]|nr:DMT family transporter [Halobacteria archaeon]
MSGVVVAIFAVSTSAILIRWSQAPSIVKAFYRVLFTTLILAPVTFTEYRSDLFSLSKRDFLIASVTGVALAVHFASWFESLEWTSVAASVTLVQTQPIFVAVGAYFILGERITTGKILGIIVAILGV